MCLIWEILNKVRNYNNSIEENANIGTLYVNNYNLEYFTCQLKYNYFDQNMADIASGYFFNINHEYHK